MSDRVLSLGEALIDVVIRPDSAVEHVGGSLLNVAVGLAALGRKASLCAYWGDDDHGRMLSDWTRRAGVTLTPGTESAPKSPVAYAHLDEVGHATYEFAMTWAVPEPPDLTQFGHLHTGSIAATLEPGGAEVLELTRRMRNYGTVSYDPNVRPALMRQPEAVVDRIENMISASDVVKASDEDLEWLYPGTPVEDIMRRWVNSGPSMVVITRGPWGAYALLKSNRDMLHLDQLRVEVADSVGAGDSFMAGMISGLLDAGLLGSLEARGRLAAAGWSAVQPALHRAVITSAITVSNHGAYAPTIDEVNAMHAADPQLL
ncbi:carbohydrate kinase family protein [Mycolicibacterium brumae]|uniref:Carbohydrate kinase n=1 Tax=Mycolicibacterium brumae TaxID=85968 RepID=A0A2G5PFY8_9MYCO|nr:carbohydrate kinase [Mycolicibacterium brumae]MCV7194375.1 carbohydrate kinase [Mycolicibacterium brumae]PIB77229.1 carbohydrate kinase [Mycolicibacterium brumae]RWA15474.1 hypothetical protein MBRU_10515 [Mycolicibacterium brumae DSM 44177]UWW10587.1 carbohydrate kinase [Mycolicibacterium brumae]